MFNGKAIMTLDQVKALLLQMDDLAGFLFENDLTGEGNNLLGSIEMINDALENHDIK